MKGIDTRITPSGTLELLSKKEVIRLKDKSEKGLYDLFRRCSLAVLNCGNETDDGHKILERYRDFDIKVVQQPRGVKLELADAPARAFVDGEMIQGIKEHLFSVLRDIVYTNSILKKSPSFNLAFSEDITNFIFHILRNAQVLEQGSSPNLVVCWGGHSISRKEYDYTKEVGHQLGLRKLNVCTGCGPGAMKGPMKGAAIAHAKQRITNGRYLGITEPGIIAAESPNPIVNELVIMPDIEKRLEAFVRTGHAVIVFPGGAGTAEEILYILGVLLHPENQSMPFPLIFTGSKQNENYFRMIDEFITGTLGAEAASRYRIIIDNPEEIARTVKAGIEEVRSFRRLHSDAYYFNWLLKVDPVFQKPFEPNHTTMKKLELHRDQSPHLLAANLRCAFSGIVSGNVKAEGIELIQEHGPFEIHGDKSITQTLDVLLESFVRENRMKLPGSEYVPCYRVIT